MICCLNPACLNPSCSDRTDLCPNCQTPLVILRNRYRPIQLIGSGGFGKTYLAEDIDELNEKCVIKQFAPQAQGTGAISKATELFEQEARQLQQLGEHPQIPALLAYFAQDQQLYLVQQFIDGENLLEELKQQGFYNEDKIREFLFDLLNILKTVHQHNVIHRDIKPQNILRRRHDQKLVLIDFGASKQLTQTVMTQPGTTIGSFGYAPPEQIQDGEAYPASDLFSLGATCFHLLTGITPWELWKQKGYGWVTTWQENVPQFITPQLTAILDKLLQIEHQQRYQSAAEVLQALSLLSSLNHDSSTITFHQYPLPPAENPSTTFHQHPLPPAEIPPTATTHRQTPPPVKAPPKVTTPLKTLQATSKPSSMVVHQQISPPLPVNAPKKLNNQFKKPLLLTGVIFLLGLGGYGIREMTNAFPFQPIAYEKFAIVNSLTGHTQWVSSLAISPDGQTLVSGSGDRSIRIWNLRTGGLKSYLKLHTDAVTSLAISPNGQTLVSGSKDGTIKIWDLQTPGLKTTLSGHKDSVNSVAISPDGQTLVSGSADKTIKIWDLQKGTVKMTLAAHNQPVWRVTISPDGKTLASGSYDKTIKLWRLEPPSLQATLTGHTNLVYSLAISPDSQTLVSGSLDKTVRIWNLSTGVPKKSLNWHKYGVSSLAISPDGQTLFSGSFDNTIRIWDLQTGELKNTLTGHTDLIYAVAITPDGQTLVSASADKTIKVWRRP